MISRGAPSRYPTADSGSEPRGRFRLGVSHALADDGIVRPAQRLREQFPALKLLLSADLSTTLLERLSAGDIDAAIILTPREYRLSSLLIAREISRDVMTVTAPRKWTFPRKPGLGQLTDQSWVLNPEGCLLRAVLLEALAKQKLAVIQDGKPRAHTGEIYAWMRHATAWIIRPCRRSA